RGPFGSPFRFWLTEPPKNYPGGGAISRVPDPTPATSGQRLPVRSQRPEVAGLFLFPTLGVPPSGTPVSKRTTMSKPNPGPQSAVQAHFLAILPRVELHATIYFRDVRCPDKREDYIQETRALAWKYFLRAIQRGKDPLTFVSQIATFAARHA